MYRPPVSVGKPFSETSLRVFPEVELSPEQMGVGKQVDTTKLPGRYGALARRAQSQPSIGKNPMAPQGASLLPPQPVAPAQPVAPEVDIDRFIAEEADAQAVGPKKVGFLEGAARRFLSSMAPRSRSELVSNFDRAFQGDPVAGLVPESLKQRAAANILLRTPGNARRQAYDVYNSPANVAERKRLEDNQQKIDSTFDRIQQGYQDMAESQLYDSSSPFNMANAAGPRMPTTAEGDLARRSRQAAAGIGDPLSAAEQSQLSEYRAKSYAAANGLPYIPPSAPRRPETSRRSLPDIKAGEMETNNEGLQVRSTVNRVTAPDGRQVTFGQGNGQGSRMAVENGNIMMTDTDGRRRAVVLPSSGYSLGLRTAEVDSQGNFIPGTFRTQSDQARREERQDLAIARGNAPNATPEEKVAGQQAQSAKDKFAAYKQRMSDRRSNALDIRREANAMRGYGPVGQQFMGLQGGALGSVNPIFATKYGQTGPSLAQAAGMVRQRRAAQERMDEAMKLNQEKEVFERGMREREMKLKEDEAARLAKKDLLLSGTEKIESMALENEAVKNLVNAPPTPDGLKSVLQRDDLTKEQKTAWMSSELGLGSESDLRNYLYQNGLEADGWMADEFTNYWNPLNWFNFIQTEGTDRKRDEILKRSPFSK